MMTTLTTRQRDILKILLEAKEPIGTGDLASAIELSPRQVNYSMKGVKKWLQRREIPLQTKPGVGVILECLPEQRAEITKELEENSNLQLVLTPGQRQQLIGCLLLIETEPIILTQIRSLLNVSRTTIINDLDIIDNWFESWGIELERKQNYGIWITNPEKQRQQVMLALIWGVTPFGTSLFEVSFQNGLYFSLIEDVYVLPLIERVNNFLQQFNLKKIFNKVVYVEDFLGGRFTDEAVLYLALVLSILVARIKMGQHIQFDHETLKEINHLPVWQAAVKLAHSLDEPESINWEEADIAYIAMQILASPRNESWRGEFEQGEVFQALLEDMLKEIGKAYGIKDLDDDLALRDGLVNHLIPVCNQHKYELWYPKTQSGLPLNDKYSKEHATARKLAELIERHISITIPSNEIDMIAALLRAAYIRLRPYHFKQVLVVCPSGMATAQLLTARLSSRFPHLGKINVVSFRELDATMINKADLIITLMPLSNELVQDKPVIQVSPQLSPEDVEAITTFLG